MARSHCMSQQIPPNPPFPKGGTGSYPPFGKGEQGGGWLESTPSWHAFACFQGFETVSRGLPLRFSCSGPPCPDILLAGTQHGSETKMCDRTYGNAYIIRKAE